ncbi:MAG: hypothetical protein IIC72_12555 [Acidobacteria bacterium]|nr:hypothetical protein [Acidobacteriota bacterium]
MLICSVGAVVSGAAVDAVEVSVSAVGVDVQPPIIRARAVIATSTVYGRESGLLIFWEFIVARMGRLYLSV